MRLVVVESPYAGNVKRNIAYAKLCVRDCLKRGEAPIASHLLFTQPGILDDLVPGERKLGIDAGHEWMEVANAVVVYTDLGTSNGMQQGILSASMMQCSIEYRKLNEKEFEKFLEEFSEQGNLDKR